MIIYENTIMNFIEATKLEHRDGLIFSIKANMHAKLGRGVSPAEEASWRTTLVQVAQLLINIEHQNEQYILLEFKVPISQKRIDVILVGSDGKRASLLIVELKGWSESFRTDIAETLGINTRYHYSVHPSAQAGEYKRLLTEQYSTLQERFANLDAVALLPNYYVHDNDPILDNQFSAMMRVIKLYTASTVDEFKAQVKTWFSSGLDHQNVDYINNLEYKPTLSFQQHLENAFHDIVLSTSQQLAYSQIKHAIDLHINQSGAKKLIIISGMPGSGKTIVAFKVLGYLYALKKLTTQLQLPGPEFRDAVHKTYDNNLVNMISGANASSEAKAIIIDEAHKAYSYGTGTQFYNAMLAKHNFVIALIDDQQVVNKKGFTKAQISSIAIKNQMEIVELELTEQFRNGADASYIDWLKHWIYQHANFQTHYVANTYHFEVLSEAEFNAKYQSYYEQYEARMVSFWTQSWNAYFDAAGKVEKRIKVGNSFYVWNPNRFWVYAFDKLNPGQKLPRGFKNQVVDKNFNATKKGAEYIAYFNTIQGYEFDYIFVHLPKLFFLNERDELDVDLSQLDFNEMKSQIWTKNKQPDPSKIELNKLYFKNRLLVNLTRGRKGTFVFCEDEKLSNWLNNKLLAKAS